MVDSRCYKYIFGPVPSRRLGRSLGVDIIKLKTCTQNCLYCQLGMNAETVADRQAYVDIDEIFGELKEKLPRAGRIDFITFSGSGEPTLNSGIGELIKKIKSITDIPVAVITNGTLLHEAGVRKDISRADLVVPSLDAGDEDTFREMNCPHVSVTYDLLVEGLVEFRKEYRGQLWLEVFFCAGINDSDDQISRIKSVIDRIRPDKVQINTSVRPTASGRAVAVSKQRLGKIAEMIGGNAEIIADYPVAEASGCEKVDKAAVLDMLKRRPCSVNDISFSLGINPGKVREILDGLVEKGVVSEEKKNESVYYKLN